MSLKPVSAEYVEQERRDFFVYTISSRAIPALADGLKPSGRRVLWMARNGEKYKSAALAGATMCIHPHDTPEDAIDTLAAPYGNNIPLFTGMGAFGTLKDPKSYGASRYTSVKISDFTKDVLFRDIEIIPMKLNYDDTLEEPVHFLPLIPIVLLNPNFGIAGGFACNILPRDLNDIIDDQLLVLDNPATTKVKQRLPYFKPTNNAAVSGVLDQKTGKTKYTFHGTYEPLSGRRIRITSLPYGIVHEQSIAHLNKLRDADIIDDYVDHTKDVIDIIVTLQKNGSTSINDDTLKFLGLVSTDVENMNVLDFSGDRVLSTSYAEVIKLFTEWRLLWYVKRYQRLADLLEIDIQRYRDVLTAIKNNVGSVARKTNGRSELIEYLTYINIVYVDYIADLSVYRFTEEERSKTEAKLKESLIQLKRYQELISKEQLRRDVYKQELLEIKTKYKNKKYERKE